MAAPTTNERRQLSALLAKLEMEHDAEYWKDLCRKANNPKPEHVFTESIGIIADGRRRLIEENEPKIRREVESEFAAEIAKASPAQRRKIQRAIKKEIEHRLRIAVPPDAVF